MAGFASGLVACERSDAATSAPLRLWLGGDVHLGAEGALILEDLDHVTRDAQGIVNLEGPVRDEPPATSPGEIRLHNAPRTLSSLKRSGVAVVGIANNHDRDGGDPRATADALAAEGLLAAHPAAPVPSHGPQRYAVTAHDLSRGIPTDLALELKAARAVTDVLVVTFHVTGPPSFIPRPELRQAVALALVSGARVVAAHGTHAVGPVERRGEAIIAWGLGNLAFACDCTDQRDGALLRVALKPHRTEALIVPIAAALGGGAVRPASDPQLMLDLFAAIGSSPFERKGPLAAF